MTPGQHEEQRLWVRDLWRFLGLVSGLVLLVAGCAAPLLWGLAISLGSGVLTARLLWPGRDASWNSSRRAIALAVAITVAVVLLIFGERLVFMAAILIFGAS